MIDSKVRVVRSDGGGCGICDAPISPGEVAIRVGFKVDLLITTKEVEKQIHVRCAEKLRETLECRIAQAKDCDPQISPRRRK